MKANGGGILYKDVRLPVGKTLVEYNFGQVPELNAAQVRQLCETTN